MVLGFEPVDKPIIPRRSFFDKGDFLALTGMFSLTLSRESNTFFLSLHLFFLSLQLYFLSTERAINHG